MNVPGKQETRVGQAEISSDILGLVADVTGADFRSLPALYETIDVDALEQLWQSADGQLMVHFDYAGCDVRLGGDGALVVCERDD